LYEHLSTFSGGKPNACHFRLYSEWAKHDWGIVTTGNVQVAPDHLTLGRDIVLPLDLVNPKDEDYLPFRRLANAIHGADLQPKSSNNKSLAIMQLSHPGRQSTNFVGGRAFFQPPMAPSPIQIELSSKRRLGFLDKLLFQTPKEMTENEILQVVDRFVYGAVFAHKTGFDGVQLHAAHGCEYTTNDIVSLSDCVVDLLAQFLSPKTNKRKDAYSLDKALNLIQTIVTRIRASTSSDFVISIKLNAADYTDSSTESSNTTLTEHEQRAMQHLLTIANWSTADIVEVSGGDYERPDFMDLAPSSASTKQKSARQAFFTRFSRQAVKALASTNSLARPLILLTGGLNTPAILQTALTLKHADLLGIGRAAILAPEIPTILRSKLRTRSTTTHLPLSKVADDNAVPFLPEPTLENPFFLSYPPISWIWSILTNVQLIGSGSRMAWYTLVMRRIALLPVLGSDGLLLRPPPPDYTLGGIQCSLWMFVWMLPSFESNGQRHRRSVFSTVLLVGVVGYAFHILLCLH